MILTVSGSTFDKMLCVLMFWQLDGWMGRLRWNITFGPVVHRSLRCHLHQTHLAMFTLKQQSLTPPTALLRSATQRTHGQCFFRNTQNSFSPINSCFPSFTTRTFVCSHEGHRPRRGFVRRFARFCIRFAFPSARRVVVSTRAAFVPNF